MAYSPEEYNGVRIWDYACSSELRGSKGNIISGIGTFVHEFGHVLGLMDHYDTDGMDSGGYSAGTGAYDVMCSGSYNNDGNTPPLMNAFELYSLGWVEPKLLNEYANIIQKPLIEKDVYYVTTDVKGECFYIENRQYSSSKWDQYIPEEGLFIMHVDYSAARSALWRQNKPNTNPYHECIKYVIAGNVNLNNFSVHNWTKVPFPYKDNNKWNYNSIPKAKSWSGKSLDFGLTDITNKDGNIHYCVQSDYTLEVGQRDALIQLMSNNYDVYRKTISGENYNEVVTDSIASIAYSDLEPNTLYNVCIERKTDDDKFVTLANIEFKTEAIVVDIPGILLPRYEYAINEKVELRAINLQKNDVVEWFIDDVAVQEKHFVANIGEHTVKCHIARGEKKYIVKRMIKVVSE